MSCVWNQKFKFQTPVCFSLVMAFVGLYLCALRGQLWIGLVLVAVSLLPLLWIHGVYAKSGDFSDSDRYAMWLLAAFWGLLSLSLLLFGLRTRTASGKGGIIILSLIAATLFAALFVLELLYIKKVCGRFPNQKKRPRELLVFLPIGILCLILVLLNLNLFDTWLRWDSYDYYYYISRVSYTSLINLEALRLANHAAYGCSFLYILVNGITGNPLVTVYAVNLFMLVAGSFLFWRILVKRFPNWKPTAHLLMTCVYAFSPFNFGLVYSISLETFLMFGILLFFWGEVEQLPLGQILGAILICFSKETGAVLLCCVMAVRLAFHIFDKKSKGTPFWSRLELPLTVPVLGLGLVWLYDLVSFSWMSSNSGPASTIQIRFNSFDFNPTYIKYRLISLLFSNFTWLIFLVALVGFVVGLIRKYKVGSKEQTVFFFECIAGAAALLISILLFVTYNHIRYAAPFVFVLILILPDALDRLFSGIKLRSFLCGVLALCSLAQCYFTVDPLMRSFFNTLEKGKGQVIYTGNKILPEGEFLSCIAVNSQYNREILYFDYAFDELLASIGYNENTWLIMSSSSDYEVPSIGGKVFAEYLIFGFGYPHMEDARYVAWDAESQSRYLSTNPSDALRVNYARTNEELHARIATYPRCVYIHFPFRYSADEDPVLRGANYKKIAESTCNGWVLEAFELYP